MLSLVALVFGSATGLIGWVPTLLIVAIGCASSGIAANSGWLIARGEGVASPRLLFLGPLEFLLWRPAMRFGQIIGVGMFLVNSRRDHAGPVSILGSS